MLYLLYSKTLLAMYLFKGVPMIKVTNGGMLWNKYKKRSNKNVRRCNQIISCSFEFERTIAEIFQELMS